MQSASDLPPPPGLLGADWLGLLPPDEVSGRGQARSRLPVANWLGKGSDNGDSVGTVAVVVAGAPAGGVNPAEDVGDNSVNGAAGVVGPEDALGVVLARKVVVGAESRGRRRSDGTGRRARLCKCGVGIRQQDSDDGKDGRLRREHCDHHCVAGSAPPGNDRCHLCGIHNLASDGISARVLIVVSPSGETTAAQRNTSW